MLGHIDNTEVVGFQVPSRLPKPRFPATLARFGTVTPLKGKLGRTVPERSESRRCLPTTDLSAFICAKGIYRQLLLTRVPKPAASTILRVADHSENGPDDDWHRRTLKSFQRRFRARPVSGITRNVGSSTVRRSTGALYPGRIMAPFCTRGHFMLRRS